MLRLLDTKSNMTQIWHKVVLLDAIANKSTIKSIQLDTIATTITRHPSLAGSNNSGEYTFFRLYSLLQLQLFLISEVCSGSKEFANYWCRV